MAAVTDDKYSLEIASIEASVAAKSVASDVLFDAKGDLIVGVANNSAAKVVVGANGTVLKANSATTTGLEWGTVSGGAGSVATDVIFDAKGDLPVGTGADTAVKLIAGANGTYLKVNSATATGLEWSAASAGSGITRSVNVTAANYTLGSAALTDYTYLVAGLHTGTLPTAVGNSNQYTVKNNHSTNVTLGTTAAQLVEGSTTISIPPQNSVDVISDGSAWRIV